MGVGEIDDLKIVQREAQQRGKSCQKSIIKGRLTPFLPPGGLLAGVLDRQALAPRQANGHADVPHFVRGLKEGVHRAVEKGKGEVKNEKDDFTVEEGPT